MDLVSVTRKFNFVTKTIMHFYVHVFEMYLRQVIWKSICILFKQTDTLLHVTDDKVII